MKNLCCLGSIKTASSVEFAEFKESGGTLFVFGEESPHASVPCGGQEHKL